MELYKTFIKNNRAVLVGHILIYAQGIILIPIIIKTVGVTIYGGFILVSTIAGLIYGISSFGVGFKSGRFLPATEGREARRNIFYPQFCFQFISIIVLSLMFILFYSFFEKLFFKGEFNFTRWLILPFLIFYFLYSQIASYFLSTHRVSYFNYATVAFPYINIALVILIYLITRSLTVSILFITQILSYMLISIPLALLFFKEMGIKFTLPDQKNLIEDVKLGFPLRINYIMDFILSSSDRYLITYFMTVAAVGYYNPAYALGSLVILFPKVSGAVLTPLLSKAIDNGRQTEAQNMLNYSIVGFLLMAIPFIFGAAILSRPLLYLFANTQVSQNAYLVTPVVAIATLFFGLNVILSNVLWVKMKTAVMLKMNMLAAFINLVLNLVLLNIFKNVLIAAFTTLISYLVVFIFIRAAVAKDWPVDFGLKIILKSIIASLLMGVVLYFITSHVGIIAPSVWFLLIDALIAIAIYVFMLFAMKTFSHKELVHIKKVFS